MQLTASNYAQRVINSKRILNNVPVGRYFIPFAYLSCLLGCWKNINSFGTAKLGDVTMSIIVTVLPGTLTYVWLVLTVVHYLKNL